MLPLESTSTFSKALVSPSSLLSMVEAKTCSKRALPPRAFSVASSAPLPTSPTLLKPSLAPCRPPISPSSFGLTPGVLGVAGPVPLGSPSAAPLTVGRSRKAQPPFGVLGVAGSVPLGSPSAAPLPVGRCARAPPTLARQKARAPLAARASCKASLTGKLAEKTLLGSTQNRAETFSEVCVTSLRITAGGGSGRARGSSRTACPGGRTSRPRRWGRQRTQHPRPSPSPPPPNSRHRPGCGRRWREGRGMMRTPASTPGARGGSRPHRTWSGTLQSPTAFWWGPARRLTRRRRSYIRRRPWPHPCPPPRPAHEAATRAPRWQPALFATTRASPAHRPGA